MNCRLRIADCGLGTPPADDAARKRIRNPKFEFRNAFTLVELLVTITIIAILSAMLLGAAALSMETARHSRTEALVSRLHTLYSQHYDTFRHRRVEVRQDTGAVRQELAALRLLGTREQLRMELPDRWSDITLVDIPATPVAYARGAEQSPHYLETRPAMSRMFLRKYNQIATNGVTRDALLQNQGAECLYLIIMLAAGDGESAGLFKETDVADTDGDGAPEFIDAWGNPIQYLRWAPGFESDVQLNYPAFSRLGSGGPGTSITPTEAAEELVAQDHDPYDLYRVDRYNPEATNAPPEPRGFRLAPLIYSAGQDGESGIEDGLGFAGSNVVHTRDQYFADNVTNAVFEQTSDPYLSVDDSHLGDLIDYAAATDNVHNHLIEGR